MDPCNTLYFWDYRDPETLLFGEPWIHEDHSVGRFLVWSSINRNFSVYTDGTVRDKHGNVLHEGVIAVHKAFHDGAVSTLDTTYLQDGTKIDEPNITLAPSVKGSRVVNTITGEQFTHCPTSKDQLKPTGYTYPPGGEYMYSLEEPVYVSDYSAVVHYEGREFVINFDEPVLHMMARAQEFHAYAGPDIYFVGRNGRLIVYEYVNGHFEINQRFMNKMGQHPIFQDTIIDIQSILRTNNGIYAGILTSTGDAYAVTSSYRLIELVRSGVPIIPANRPCKAPCSQ